MDQTMKHQHIKVNGYQLQVTLMGSCKWSKVRSKFMLETPLLWSRQLLFQQEPHTEPVLMSIRNRVLTGRKTSN